MGSHFPFPERSIGRSTPENRLANLSWMRRGRDTKIRALQFGRKKNRHGALSRATRPFSYLLFSSFLPFRDANTILNETRTARRQPTGPGKRLTRMANYLLGAPPLRHLAPWPGARSGWRGGSTRCVQRFPHLISHALEFPRWYCPFFDLTKSTLRDLMRSRRQETRERETYI